MIIVEGNCVQSNSVQNDCLHLPVNSPLMSFQGKPSELTRKLTTRAVEYNLYTGRYDVFQHFYRNLLDCARNFCLMCRRMHIVCGRKKPESANSDCVGPSTHIVLNRRKNSGTSTSIFKSPVQVYLSARTGQDGERLLDRHDLATTL